MTNIQMNQDQSHTRIIDTLLGSLERKALQWLAARMPKWIVPDTLTAIGLFASVLIFASYALTSYNKNFLWLASFAFVVNWFGDSLDGTLARFRKIERPRYGFFVDHIIDAVSEALIFIGLGLSPLLRFDLALITLVSYLLLSVYVYLVTYVNGVFRISYARLGPTEVRVIGIIANTVVFFTSNPQYRVTFPAGSTVMLTFYDMVAIWVTLMLLGIFIVSTITTAMSLSREDRVAHAEKNRVLRAERAALRKARREERLLRKSVSRISKTRRRSRLQID